MAALVAAIPADVLDRRIDPPGHTPHDGTAPPVVDLTHDSRQVGRGWAFVCIPGDTVDGHDFAPAAVAQGASVIIVERPLDLPVPQIVVTDARRAAGPAAAVVHGSPANRLDLIGVTGTNGKTTVTHMLAAVLAAVGRDVEQVGTLSGVRTTPEAADLQRSLAGFVADGIDTVVMEVSSHALALHRVDGCRFDVSVFTNLSQDHLDLHGSMEAYFRAKALLFEPALSDLGVVNRDDTFGRLLTDAAPIEMRTYSSEDASDVRVGVREHRFTWRGHDVVVPVGGTFNVSNSLAALTASVELGIDAGAAVAGLAGCPPIPGRFEHVSGPGDDIDVVVDYAHTPDGIAALIDALRDVADGRVVLVFGCGGERDADKRSLMGAAATAADVVVVTSDNPRREDPDAIIAAAVAGVDRSGSDHRYRDALIIDADRRRAIRAAIDVALPGDVVAIAGKGHETTQTIGLESLPFDDRVEARAGLERRRHDGECSVGAAT